MWLDHRSSLFHTWRNRLDVIVAPLHYVVDMPIKTVMWFGTSVTAQRELLEDNTRLRAHEMLLESRLQKLLALEKENAQLKKLLSSTAKVGGKVKVAQLLAIDLNPALNQAVINLGKAQRLYVGQPVLDSYGVMGQIVDVTPYTSKVLLVTDARSAVPVQNYRTGVRAIAMGQGSADQLALINVPDTSDVQPGDSFVCSGLGLHYPVGYPVGVVTKVEHVPGRRFAKVTLKPAAHLDQTGQVLLAWPSNPAVIEAASKELAKPVAIVDGNENARE